MKTKEAIEKFASVTKEDSYTCLVRLYRDEARDRTVC